MRHALFSLDAAQTAAGIAHVQAWRCRGRVPLGVDTTALLVSAQLRDPAACAARFVALPQVPHVSDDALASEYALTIIRFVNGISDASQKGKVAGSVAKHAEAAGLHPMLVDIRHEATHNHMPSLHLLRLAVSHALTWLAENYWAAQAQHTTSSRQSVAATLAELWQNQRARAAIACSAQAQPAAASTSDDDSDAAATDGNSVSELPAADLSAAALKRAQRALLGTIRNVIPEGSAADLADILVAASSKVLMVSTSPQCGVSVGDAQGSGAQAAAPGGTDATQRLSSAHGTAASVRQSGARHGLPDGAETSLGAATLTLLSEQHAQLAAHVLVQSAAHLTNVKAAVLCALVDGETEQQRVELLHCRGLIALHCAARRAVRTCGYAAAEQFALLEHCSVALGKVPDTELLNPARKAQALELYYGAVQADVTSEAQSCAAALASLDTADPPQVRELLFA